MTGQEEAKQALIQAASSRHVGGGKILLLGPSRSTKLYLARVLAHALEVPFAMGDASDLVQTKQSPENLLLLSSLLERFASA